MVVANYKLHYKLRQVSFPFDELVKLIPRRGKLWDVGCGFGHLVKLLLQRNPRQKIYAFDIDSTKLRVSGVKRGVPKSRVKTITLIDVLYLMTDGQKIKLLQKLFNKLQRGGKLIIAIVPKDRSWQYYLAWLQEWVMVKLLGKTESKEKAINFETENWLRQNLDHIGFRQIKRYQLPRTLFFWHKHVVFVATK